MPFEALVNRRYKPWRWRLVRWGAAQVDYCNGFKHADPAALAFVAGDHEAEWALIGAERLAIDGVHDQDGFAGEILVEFGQRKDGTVTVGAFRNDCERHALAS